MARTRYTLGPIPLDYTATRWPLYRGVVARRVQLDQTVGKLPRLEALPRIVDFTVEASRPRSREADRRVFKNVRVLEVGQASRYRSYVVLADARVDLEYYVNAVDVNISFEDGLLPGTAFMFIADAAREMLTRVRMSASQRLKVAAAIAGYEAPDGQPLAGMNLPSALATVFEIAGVDLTVDWSSGDLMLVDKADRTGQPPQALANARWLQDREPPWLLAQRQVYGIPNEVHVFSTERHVLRVEPEDVAGTSVPQATMPMLTNVFSVGEQFLTLEELFGFYGQPLIGTGSPAILNRYLAFNILRRNWTPPLERDGSADRDAFIAVLQRDWRTLWRVDFPDGQRGMWTDPAFGRFDLSRATSDPLTGEVSYGGELYGTPVLCPWYEDIGTLSPVASGSGDVIGMVSGRNHEINPDGTLPESPFIPQWVNQDAGVFRLTVPRGLDGTNILPGNVMTLPGVDWARTENGTPQIVDGIWNIERVTTDRLRFVERFPMHVFIAFTRRVPNNTGRWHLERVKSGDVSPLAGSAPSVRKVDVIELEPSASLLAYRDYVDAQDPNHQPGADGLGPVVNAADLAADARRRATLLLDEMARPRDGEGEAVALSGLTNAEGSVEQCVVDINENWVSTIVEVGNLASTRQRLISAEARRRSLVVESGGKVVEAGA